MERLEEHAHIGTIDALAGYGAAAAVGAALYQRARIGRAGRARTSLTSAAGLLQVPFFYDYAGRRPFDEPSGPGAKGWHALAHLYQAGCGRTVMLSASERDLPRLARVAGLEGLGDVAKEERASFLARAFRRASAEEWLSRLHGVGVAICGKLETLRSENSRLADGTPGTERGSYSFSTRRDHPSGHAITQVDDHAVRPEVGKVYALPPAEKFGASTRQVLRSFEYTDPKIDALLAAGAISESWSREYLPS